MWFTKQNLQVVSSFERQQNTVFFCLSNAVSHSQKAQGQKNTYYCREWQRERDEGYGKAFKQKVLALRRSCCCCGGGRRGGGGGCGLVVGSRPGGLSSHDALGSYGSNAVESYDSHMLWALTFQKIYSSDKTVCPRLCDYLQWPVTVSRNLGQAFYSKPVLATFRSCRIASWLTNFVIIFQ